ncbi:glutathione hydrolase-like YwrD proenzyme [Haliotis rufescens]|uniref:glutathione hydrolase-like YwrD proenzyme n=1 Tax=Haliotis rufescens TaxID=6454 RepID=UPI00201E87DE|nr:glutathione hydrolase-like YwrD proenzyme [Haliotis rufescens]
MGDTELKFKSRRSCVVSRQGSVASSQPLASQIGRDVLKSGGNAADAAVAMAAALNVTEPCSTGIGGDAFCLFYDARSKTVKGLNGSGRAPSALTLDLLKGEGFSKDHPFPVTHPHAVTVPGAAAAWVDTVEKFGSGKLTMSQILGPAIDLAENGFPVQQCTAYFWNKGAHLLSDASNTHGHDLLLNGAAPRHGDLMTMPNLAKTFRAVAADGKKGFYEGRVAQSLVDVVQQHGGAMTLDDLKSHVTTFEEPISVDYRGCRVWEIPPSGHGIVALMALNILEGFDLKSKGHNSAEYLHLLIEALRLSFADTQWYCADPAKVSVPIQGMISKQYAGQRRQLISETRAKADMERGSPTTGSDTVYFTAVDCDGNACSFINSNFMGFGTGIVPDGCGFTLQNRGAGFSLDPKHPNCVAGGKRPYHTIIPSMVTSADTGDLLCTLGVMGGYMQPQGHVQVLLNMLEFHMDPQEALDQPRFLIGGGYGLSPVIAMEDGISEETLEKLKNMGHPITGHLRGHDRSKFGRGQVITRGNWWQTGSGHVQSSNVLWSGSDPRADGQVAAY